MKMIDWSKPVQTRDGRKVRILCTDGEGDFPVVGIVGMKNGRTNVYSWHENGQLFSRIDSSDLINVPIKREGWIVVGVSDDPLFPSIAYASHVFATKADAFAYGGYIDGKSVITPISWEE